MHNNIDILQKAQKKAISIRPKVGGFPYVAEVMRQAGIRRNSWSLPSCQSIYDMENGSVVQQVAPLVVGACDIPHFDKEALVRAIRTDQAGESSFPEFLKSAWDAGVTRYVADFEKRIVAYFGANDETYIERYPEVKL